MAKSTRSDSSTTSHPGAERAGRKSSAGNEPSMERNGSGSTRAPGRHGREREESQTREGRDKKRGSAGGGGAKLSSAGSGVVNAVREHPVPAIMIGAGLTWLLLESQAARGVETRVLNQAKQAAKGVGSALGHYGETAREAFSEGTESGRRAMSSAAETVGRGLHATADTLKEGASAVSHGVQAGYERSKDAIGDAWERHPLIVGASLLAAGVVAGLALPGTRREGSLMGRASADLSEKARTTGARLLEKGREIIGASGEAAPTRKSRRRSKRATA